MWIKATFVLNKFLTSKKWFCDILIIVDSNGGGFTRKLLLVWYEKENNILNLIGELQYNGIEYKFKYLNYETNELQLFSKNGLFYGFNDVNTEYVSDELFPSILSRIPSQKRIDYFQILKKYNLGDNAPKFDVLEKTKGEISTDKFIFITEEEYCKLNNELN